MPRRSRRRPPRPPIASGRFDRYDRYGFAPYVPVEERQREAARILERLRKKGQVVSPVEVSGRDIATTFWGRAWCGNLESYSDFANRLPRGRTYLRNGSVIDLQVGPGRVQALVSGSEVYTTAVTVSPVSARHWRDLCAQCAGGIDSLVELLQGRFSEAVMGHLCRQRTGLFPTPAEIRFSCTCPDAASMCKHVAAVLYGVGARLDQQPELLFRLRQVDEHDLLARATTDVPLSAAATTDASRILADEDLAALFGLELGPPLPEKPAAKRPRRPRTRR